MKSKIVPDIDDALDPAHTDALHERWLKTAKAKDFKLNAGLSMFQLELAYAPKKGGPLVQDRWQHAKILCAVGQAQRLTRRAKAANYRWSSAVSGAASGKNGMRTSSGEPSERRNV